MIPSIYAAAVPDGIGKFSQSDLSSLILHTSQMPETKSPNALTFAKV